MMTRRIDNLTVPSLIWQQSDYEKALYSALITPFGLQASAGELFNAVFGRDSLQVGLDLAPWYRDIALLAAISLARFQGLEYDPLTEEARGRIFHELRLLSFGLGRISREQTLLLERLAARWGKPRWLKRKTACVYYGSADATFTFITLCAQLGPTILDTKFMHSSGRHMTLRQSVMAALEWCLEQINPETGLVEFKRVNPQGHPFQVMRDGLTAHIHLNGNLANYQAPVATLDLQLIADRALKDAQLLLGSEAPGELENIRSRLQTATFRLFSMPGQSFAMALDRDTAGGLRQVQTQTSVMCEFLESSIFDGLGEEERRTYIQSIVRRMYGDDFLTPAGIRMRALSQSHIVPYWDYQGSFTTWPVITGRFARGLRAVGLEPLARDMEARMQNAIQLAGIPYEFFMVDEHGRVHYDVKEVYSLEGKREVVAATNKPEHIQAWTVSAALHSLRTMQSYSSQTEPWADEFVREIVHNKGVERIVGSDALREAFPTQYGFSVDVAAGQAAEAEFSSHWQ